MTGDQTLLLEAPADAKQAEAERPQRQQRRPPSHASVRRRLGWRPRPAACRTDRAWWHPAALAALPLATLLWVVSLRQGVRLDRMAAYGLISVLPVTFWAALAVLTLGFALALRRPRTHSAWFAGYVVALIALLHATPTLLYGTLRYSWAWKHVAVVDYLLRHGATDPTNGDLGAYHQWPGFFALNGLFANMAGLHSAAAYAAWAPPVDNLLLIGPLVLIYRSLTRDRRLIWAAVWIFFSCAWVGQDYFSPQAYALVLYLSLIGILLSRLSHRAADPAEAEAALIPEIDQGAPALMTARPGRGAALWTVLLLPVIAAVASSHQLTPLMLISATAVLAASHRRWRTVLPLFVVAAVFAIAWAGTVARPFIKANVHSIVASFGALDSNAGGRLSSQATANLEQRTIAHVETISAIVVWLLAAAAVAKWRGLRRSPAVLLAVAPLPLLAANDYGGEMVFRIYLFALPATAFLGAALLWRSGRRWPLLHAIAFPLALVALLSGFIVGYYGKERMNYFSPAEVAATDYLYQTAPRGSVIIAATSEYPGAYTDYEYYARVAWLADLTARQRDRVAADPLSSLVNAMRTTDGRPAYFILTRSQEAEVELSGLLPPAALTQVEQIPGGTPQLRVIYRNADAVIMVLARPPSGTADTERRSSP